MRLSWLLGIIEEKSTQDMFAICSIATTLLSAPYLLIWPLPIGSAPYLPEKASHLL